jgi:hypothetical protein
MSFSDDVLELPLDVAPVAVRLTVQLTCAAGRWRASIRDGARTIRTSAYMTPTEAAAAALERLTGGA